MASERDAVVPRGGQATFAAQGLRRGDPDRSDPVVAVAVAVIALGVIRRARWTDPGG